ncbi:MAG: HD-GYP domain-containing protein [Spirochaetaceae bacterium]|jgi:HD-GYP domain-containing protein (c-di-GMP phosphodiesterase class II)|nr:HD-GYP domain-containing protein [Spirochaetaceae bacterium]
MKKIVVESLEAGYVFSAPVYIDEGNVFVDANVPLEQKDIDRIMRWNITEVLTDGEIIDGPGIKRAKGAAQNAPELRSSQPEWGGGQEGGSLDQETAFYAAITGIIQQLNAIFVLIERRQFDITRHGRQINAISAGLSDVIQNGSRAAVSFVLNGNLAGYSLAKNAVQTAILSVSVFRELSANKVPHQDLLLGALFHDMGMVRLPKAITEKKGQLSDLERELMQAHVVYGYQIVRQELRFNDIIGDMVLQHHERWNGTGYTQQLNGSRIGIGAKIISVADAFEAMVNEKPYRNSMTGYEAVRNLLSDNAHRFDPSVLATFVKIMGIYPVGQEVLLNDGRTARVIEARQQAPLRPLVVITRGKDGTPAGNEKPVDLLNQPSLYIVRATRKQKE